MHVYEWMVTIDPCCTVLDDIVNRSMQITTCIDEVKHESATKKLDFTIS